jgi:Asp-tRNA(Asn)/Glu-tRNA(Gln) amidotransferase A subunit family amidase
VGYKPTFGFFGIAGLKPLSPTQDTIGLLARTVEDAAFFAFGLHGAKAVAGPDLRPRLAVCHSRQWEALRPEMAQAIEQLAGKAERSGARVTHLTLPAELDELVPMQMRLFAFEARQSLAQERQHHSAQFSERLKRRLEGGIGISPAEYLGMRRRAVEARHKVRALFDDVDALLYPPAQGEADIGLLDSGSAQFGALWSLLHLPCIAVPTSSGPAGLPMGTQVIGGYGQDEKLLAVAQFVSRAAQDHS